MIAAVAGRGTMPAFGRVHPNQTKDVATYIVDVLAAD
jgi:mono/diheme cytochrome c family protein